MYKIQDVRTGLTIKTVNSHAVAWLIVTKYSWLAIQETMT